MTHKQFRIEISNFYKNLKNISNVFQTSKIEISKIKIIIQNTPS